MPQQGLWFVCHVAAWSWPQTRKRGVLSPCHRQFLSKSPSAVLSFPVYPGRMRVPISPHSLQEINFINLKYEGRRPRAVALGNPVPAPVWAEGGVLRGSVVLVCVMFKAMTAKGFLG